MTLKAMLGAYDPGICGVFCAPFNLQPSCVEEHEAYHVMWIQAEITYEEFKEVRDMGEFNSYVVFDKDGELIAHDRTGERSAITEPTRWFGGLSPDIRGRAQVMFVFQEHGCIARYKVQQPTVPAPSLGLREVLFERDA